LYPPEGEGQPTHPAVGTAATSVVTCVAAGPHCAHTLGPVAPGVQPGTTWVVRSVGGSGETVTVRAVVLVEPEGQLPELPESWCAEQVSVLWKV
jgi:hypothetical protein